MFESIKSLFKEKRQDGWQNPLSNLGTLNSRTGSTFYGRGVRLDFATLREIYHTEGISQRIVNLVVEDALRGFIEGDKLLLEELNRLDTEEHILNAGQQARLYGGAMIVAFVEDRQGFEKPLNMKTIERVVSLRVFDMNQVTWEEEDICRDFSKEYYGSPEIFKITSQRNNCIEDEGNFMKIHRSRCFILKGNKNCDNEFFWGRSILESCYEALRRYGIITGSSTEIVHDFTQVIMKIKGLSDAMSNGEEKGLQKRIDLLDRTRSTSNLILLDGDEDGNESYEKKSSSVAGLSELWDRIAESICASCGIPKTKLFGSSPAGMNSTGKSDLQQWYDTVRSYRRSQIKPCIDRLVEILKYQKSWKNKPNNFAWEFPSLTAPSEEEWADIKKKYAEIDAIYMDRGAVDPVEVWNQRYGRGEFHINIKLDQSKDDEDAKDIIIDEDEVFTRLKQEDDF